MIMFFHEALRSPYSRLECKYFMHDGAHLCRLVFPGSAATPSVFVDTAHMRRLALYLKLAGSVFLLCVSSLGQMSSPQSIVTDNFGLPFVFPSEETGPSLQAGPP